jgi:rod shape-determining protein MreD
MTTSFWHRLDQGARNAVPALSCFAIVLIGVVPLRIPLFGPISPLLALIPIYYWGVHRPDLMPFVVVFLIGLFHDVLTGAPLGVHSFIYLICHFLVISQRRVLSGKNVLLLWWGFLIVTLIAVTLEWLVFSAFNLVLMPVEPLAFRVLITAALFPLFGWMMIQLHRFVIPTPRGA